VPDGARFCPNCGQPLQGPGGVITSPPSDAKKDPYKDQIAQLKLEIKQWKLALKKITTKMSATRSQYYETAAFVPHGILRQGYKWFEDLRLLGPQQQKQRLQEQIMQLEQELLDLQRAQAEWKEQRQN
jgi:flagellar biosynthesis chaperone FliJ